jgi:hypothetical protein
MIVMVVIMVIVGVILMAAVIVMRVIVMIRVVMVATVRLMVMIIVSMIVMSVIVVGDHAMFVVPGIRGMLVSVVGLRCLRIGARAFHHLALHAIAMAAATRIAMAGAAAVAAILVLFLGFAMGALVGLDQGLPVGDRDLVIVGMDFAESQEAVAVTAIFDEGGLQRRLYAGDLGEVNVSAQLLALGGLEVKLFDTIAADHDDPGLFRVGGIDQHLVGHFGTLDGGGRGAWRAQIARPGDATVHLIRG